MILDTNKHEPSDPGWRRGVKGRRECQIEGSADFVTWSRPGGEYQRQRQGGRRLSAGSPPIGSTAGRRGRYDLEVKPDV
jgi:hypothetical protein